MTEPAPVICVELFGIPRQRVGRAQLDVPGRTLGEILARLAAAHPEFARDCLRDGGLHPTCLANINGERFTADNDAPLAPGDAVLILSADVGG